MRVSACPRCASLQLRLPGVADGGILGYSVLSEMVCTECGFTGSPLLLSDETEYRRFRDEVLAGAGTAPRGGPRTGADDADGADGADGAGGKHRWVAVEDEGDADQADLEERAALTPQEREFLEDAQRGGEPCRPWLTVIFIAILGAVLIALTPFAVVAIIGGSLSASLLPLVFGVGLALSGLQGWAYFRVAKRMWVKASMG